MWSHFTLIKINLLGPDLRSFWSWYNRFIQICFRTLLWDKDIPRIFTIVWIVCTRLYVYSIFVPLGTFVIVLCELAWKPSAVIKKNLTFFGGHFARWMGETKIQIGWLYREDCTACVFPIHTFSFMIYGKFRKR